jgi:hypothetical protein
MLVESYKADGRKSATVQFPAAILLRFTQSFGPEASCAT